MGLTFRQHSYGAALDCSRPVLRPGLVFRLFPIELERLHHGSIADGKKNRLFIGEILMRMPLPKRDDERISLLPFEVTLSHGGSALSFEHVIQGRAGMAMVFGFLCGFEKLNLTGHGRISVAGGGRIDIA